MESTVARPGRKPIPANQGKRASLGLKVTPDIKNKLDDAARANGRTQSQEAEARLERSFERQGQLGEILDMTYQDARLVALLLAMSEAMRDAVQTIERGRFRQPGDPKRDLKWLDDPDAFEFVASAARAVMDAACPEESADDVARRVAVLNGESSAAFMMKRIVTDNYGDPPSPWLAAFSARAGVIDERFRQRWLALMRKANDAWTAVGLEVQQRKGEPQ